MVPQTYPSVYNTYTNRTEMVVYQLSSVVGMVRWTDYIPVKLTTSTNASKDNTTDNDGCIATNSLSSVSGKKAFIDYIPVYIDNSATDAWQVSASGFIPYGISGNVISILKSYGANAHVYLPGIGVLNGLTAGNYLDSAGTTQGTVDQPVGLDLDAMGVVGAELVVNGDFSAGATGWNLQTGWSVSAGVATHAGASADSWIYQAGAPAVGKLYLCTFTVTSFTAGGVCFGNGSNRGAVRSSTGTFQEYIYCATAANIGVNVPSTFDGSVDNVSVREITGIHATQPTTASKPILRRGAVNLLTYSQDFTNAAWTKTATGAAVGLLTPDTSASLHRVYQPVSAISNGVGCTLQLKLKSNGIRFIYVNAQVLLGVQICVDLQTGSVINTGGSNITCLLQADGYYLLSVNGTCASQVNGVYLQANNSQVANDVTWASNGTDGFYAKDVALFQGTYTAAQIQALGGIPLTTTAPASTALGPYWWEFKGTHSLGFSGPLFQMVDDHCVIAGAKLSSIGSDATIYSQSNASNHQLPWVKFDSTGHPASVWFDGTNFAQSISSETYVGSPIVSSTRRVGASGILRVNGVSQGATSLAAMGNPTLTSASIGTFNAGSLFFTGSIYPVIAVKGTVTDADLLTLERFVGNLSGVAI